MCNCFFLPAIFGAEVLNSLSLHGKVCGEKTLSIFYIAHGGGGVSTTLERIVIG